MFTFILRGGDDIGTTEKRGGKKAHTSGFVLLMLLLFWVGFFVILRELRDLEFC